MPHLESSGILSVSSPLRNSDTPTAQRLRDVHSGGATPGSTVARNESQMYKAEVQRLKFQLRTSEGE